MTTAVIGAAGRVGSDLIRRALRARQCCRCARSRPRHVCDWGIPDHGQLQRVSAISTPVFVANGDSDPMIRPHFSYLLAGLIPRARVKIYPDAAHGFVFQYHAEFAGDVDAFLRE